MKKKSFVMRTENLEQLQMLSDDQCGQLLKAILAYADDGTLLETQDKLLKMMFSIYKGQIDRDAAKYEEVCRKRSENGKKGGAPKGNQNALKHSQNNQKQAKQTKQADSDTDTDTVPDPEPEPDPDSECECDTVPDPESACAEHTPHTTHNTKQISLQEILELAGRIGYDWDEAEARDFLVYNLDKGRTGGWSFAVRKWEENRSARERWKQKNAARSAQEQDEMNDYLSVVNRFPKEDANG